MKKYLAVLRKCPLFDGMTEEELLQILGCLKARVVELDKKYTVFPEGKPVKQVGVVLSGGVQIEQTDYDGNRSILAQVGPSQLFGEAFACAQVPAIPVTVVASEPSEVLLLDCEHILHTCASHCGFHQQMIFNLMRDLAHKTLLFHQRMDILAKRTTRDKLMAYLTLQARQAGSRRFIVPFDRQELADYLEVDRSGLSAEISKLRREGILQSDRKEFVLL